MRLFKYFLLLTTLIFSQHSLAQPIWWLGGTGDWDDQNWSLLGPAGANCSCIPNASNSVAIIDLPGVAGTEQVTIPDLFSANAKTVFVDSNTILQIGTNSLGEGILTVEDPSSRGMDIYGTVRVRDILNIHDAPEEAAFVRQSGELIVQTSGLINIIPNDAIIGKGIVNHGLLETRSNMNNGTRGIIKIKSINDIGIENMSTGDIQNNGTLDISLLHVSGEGILNRGGGSILVNNLGKIVVDQVGGANINGIQNNGLLTSDGMIDVTNASGAAAISNFKNSGFANAFTNNGSISITNSLHHGIRNHSEGNFNNDGSLSIINVSTNNHQGIWNEATFRNKSKGSITISDINDPFCRGIYNQNVFENEGTISIDDVDGGNGFRNESSSASFTNMGKLTISNTVFQGLMNVTNAFILNSDSIMISAITHSGVHNHSSSTLNNTGYIEVSGSIGPNAHGIHNQNQSVFNNGGSAKIVITDINGSGSTGFLNGGATLNNNALILISQIEFGLGFDNSIGSVQNNDIIQVSNIENNIGIRNLGIGSQFVNSGNLISLQTWGHGLYNDRSFTNNNNLSCTDIDGLFQHGIFNGPSGDFTNSANGVVNVNDVNEGAGIRNHNVWLNDGTMNVSFITTYEGIHAILSSTLTNNGTISISNTNINGINLEDDCVFSNSGDLNIQSIQTDSYAIKCSATFNHNANGKIQILQNTGGGIRIFDGGAFNASDSVIIEDCQNTGVLVDNNSTFTNNADGVIEIDNITNGPGIRNKFNFFNAGRILMSNLLVNGIINDTDFIFNNLDGGVISIENKFAMTGMYSINNLKGRFTNAPCGEMTVLRGTRVVMGTFDNQGFLFVKDGGIQIFSQNGAEYQNTGVIEFQNGAFLDDLEYIDNVGIIAPALGGHHVVGVVSAGVMLGDGSGLSFSPTYFNTPALSLDVGPFDPHYKEWLPSAAGINTIYINIDNGCMDRVIEQQLVAPTLAMCSEIPLDDITTDESGSWNDQDNWDPNQVPTACYDILMVNTDSLTIDSGTRGYGKTLDVQLGSHLEVLGELEIGN